MNEQTSWASTVEQPAAQCAPAAVTVSVPSSRAQLAADAAEFGAWATASKWALAALVWAWVKPGEGQGVRVDLGTSPTSGRSHLSANQFAQLGVKGLKSDVTVAAYHAAWQWAVDHGHAKPAVKGEVAVLPALDWELAKLERENGPASPKVPADPKPVPEFFSVKVSPFEKSVLDALREGDALAYLQTVRQAAKALGFTVEFTPVDVEDVAVNYSARESKHAERRAFVAEFNAKA